MKGVSLVCAPPLPRCGNTSPTPETARGKACLRALVLANALTGLIGCAPSILPVTPSTATRINVPPQPSPADSTSFPQPATIEVRYYAHSPTVTIVGWDPAETAYGLRAWLRRDGALIRGHRLYVSSYYTPARPAFTRAVTPSRPLELTGISRDVQSCVGGRPCSPPETFGALIPDALLRSSCDSLAVTFYNHRSGRQLLITLHRDLIDAYLGRLDSVVAVMRKQ
jgi:hypothetical protein